MSPKAIEVIVVTDLILFAVSSALLVVWCIAMKASSQELISLSQSLRELKDFLVKAQADLNALKESIPIMEEKLDSLLEEVEREAAPSSPGDVLNRAISEEGGELLDYWDYK